MRSIDYTEKLKEFRGRLAEIDNEDMLEYSIPTTYKNKIVAIVNMPESVDTITVLNRYRTRYAKQKDKINTCDAPASDIICDFITFCETNWNPYDSSYDVLVPDSGLDDFSFLKTETESYDINRLIVITIEDFDDGRQIKVFAAKTLLDAMDNGDLNSYMGNQDAFDDINFDTEEPKQTLSYDNESSDFADIEEIDPNDTNIKVVKTMEPTEPLDIFLEKSKVWLGTVANDKQKIRDAHASIIVTLRDIYLQTFEQIAKLLNDYYGVTRTRQSIHSLYERVKKRESAIVDYETQREILMMRLLGLSISKIHERFTHITEYGIGEIINSNKREYDELKDGLIDTLANKLNQIASSTGKYRLNTDTVMNSDVAIRELKESIEMPGVLISTKVFNELLYSAINKIINDKLECMASIIYETHVPGLKSAKRLMMKYGLDNNEVTARRLKDTWTK